MWPRYELFKTYKSSLFLFVAEGGSQAMFATGNQKTNNIETYCMQNVKEKEATNANNP